MPKLYIMCSVPGGGKGHWIQENLNARAIVCSADHHFYELGHGIYAFDPSQLGVAHSKCQAKVETAMANGEDVIVLDNTNLHAKHMKPYLKAAKDHDYEVEIIRITPQSGFVAWSRNTHGVPQEAHQRMQQQFVARSLPAGIKVREICEKHPA